MRVGDLDGRDIGIKSVNCLIRAMAAVSDTPTTLTVKASTLARLGPSKTPGTTLDDVFNDLMADTPPVSFWREIERRRREPGPNIPGPVMLRRLRGRA